MNDIRKLLSLPCACASLRRSSRALTAVYEESLRPHGLTLTQFTILQVLSLAGELTQGSLGEALVMDSTSLSRTLRPMTAKKWVAVRRGDDRRQRFIRVAAEGRSKFRRASSAWEITQQKLRAELGGAGWEQLFAVTNTISGTALQLTQ
jgi:DNA-binding MarR family transcriptional regulator